MVLYFTGTGNSRYVAKIIAQSLGSDAVSLGDAIKQKTSIEFTDDTLVIVTPTYAWQIPHLVREYLKSCGTGEAKRAYFVMTCGDDIGNAGAHCEKLCNKIGVRFMGVSPVIMPENYVAMFDVPKPSTAKKIIDAALPEIDRVIALIKNGEHLPKTKLSAADRLKSGIVNSAFYTFCVTAKGFYVKSSCTHCGKCARLCPLSNITLNDSGPEWGNSCTHCMACICACPAEAIEYKKVSPGKPRHYLD